MQKGLSEKNLYLLCLVVVVVEYSICLYDSFIYLLNVATFGQKHFYSSFLLNIKLEKNIILIYFVTMYQQYR